MLPAFSYGMLPANPGLLDQLVPALLVAMEGDLGGKHEDTCQPPDPGSETFGWLMEAWATDPMLRSLALLLIAKPRMPCLALHCDKNGRCSARMFKDTDLGADIAIKPGSHAFVQ